MLDMTVYGRQEAWEHSPKGWPQWFFNTTPAAAHRRRRPRRQSARRAAAERMAAL
jgi:hypothetical protein